MTRLRVVDFETTGVEPPEAQVCEVGICDLVREADDGPWRVEAPLSWLCGGIEVMPPEVRAVHHITAAELAGKDPFDRMRVLAGDWGEGAGVPAIIVAHNLEFEAKFLGEHSVPQLCTYKAALRVWPDAPAHSNSVLRYWLEDQGLIPALGDAAMPSHRAGPDALVTAHILKALLETGTRANDMVVWTKEPRLLPTNPIDGRLKEKGKPWAEVSHGLLTWLVGTETMGEDLRWNAQRELDRRRAER